MSFEVIKHKMASSKNIPIIEAKKAINFSLPDPPSPRISDPVDSTILTSPIFLIETSPLPSRFPINFPLSSIYLWTPWPAAYDCGDSCQDINHIIFYCSKTRPISNEAANRLMENKFFPLLCPPHKLCRLTAFIKSKLLL